MTSQLNRVKRIISHLSPAKCTRQHTIHDVEFITKLLDVIEYQIIPKTRKGVLNGNKIFGGAILNSSGDAIYCGTNKEIECPLYHGEISTIQGFYDKQLNKKFKSNIFLSTHEPCSMCLSAITWSGFKKIYYFFGYDMTTNDFNIPHDIKILQSVFGKKCSGKTEYYYNKSNEYFQSYHILELINNIKDEKIRE
eukprot:224203_1